jgi:hypothetical protein
MATTIESKSTTPAGMCHHSSIFPLNDLIDDILLAACGYDMTEIQGIAEKFVNAFHAAFSQNDAEAFGALFHDEVTNMLTDFPNLPPCLYVCLQTLKERVLYCIVLYCIVDRQYL